MAAEAVRIEIPIETVDETEPELSNLIGKLGKLGKAEKEAGQSASRASGEVSRFDRAMGKTGERLNKLTRGKYQLLLEAKDRIAPILSALGGKLRNFTRRTWRVTVRATDLVTRPIRGILRLLKNPLLSAGAVLGVGLGVKDSIETYGAFQKQMSQVKAISGATEEEFARLTEKAKEMGETTKFTATESGQAFQYMAMAGWKTEQMMGGIEGIMDLAAASGEDLGTTSDIVTDALTAFGLKAKEAGHFADVLAAASSNSNTNVSMMGETFKYAANSAGTLGYSIEDTALAIGLMANTGIKSSMAGTALQQIMNRLAVDTNGARSSIEALGVKFYDAQGKARPFGKLIDDLREKTSGMNKKGKEFNELMTKIGGVRGGNGLKAILGASEEDYRKLKTAIEEADGSSKSMADTMINNMSGAMTLLQSKVEGVKNSFGERLEPYVVSFANWVKGEMPNIENGISSFMDAVDEKVEHIKKTMSNLMSTSEWQNAGFFGKIKLSWDELIAKPFSEWWNSTGKRTIAEKIAGLGHGIGSAINTGILTLLGFDVTGVVDEAAGLGAKFAKGFADGLDFGAISEKLWEGLQNLFSNASKLLPGGESADLSSLLSAGLLFKIFSPIVKGGAGLLKAGKGIAGLFGGGSAVGAAMEGAASGAGILSGLGNIIGSASSGTGILGKSALLAIDMGAGNLAGGASLSAGALSALGLGTIAGAAVGGASAISGGLDIYHALTTDDQKESEAYGTSGALKVGGVAAGAAIGTLILPGIGTAIGAGIGGLAGWIAGDKIKNDYEDEVEEAEKAAANARKAMEVTGRDIESLKFANQDLQAALNDSEVSAEQFAQMFKEEVTNKAVEAFGKITLTAKELKKVAGDITFGEMTKGLDKFDSASKQAEKSLSVMQSAKDSLEKENWKVAIDIKLDKSEKENYKKSIDTFVESAQQYINDSHYEAKVALEILSGGEADSSGLDSMYSGFEKEIAKKYEKLQKKIKEALKDGVISTEPIKLKGGTLKLSEADEIENLQNQITKITNKISSAKTEAQFDALQIKSSGAALDANSFAALQKELQANVTSAQETYDEALTVTLTNLNLELSEGAINQKQYDKAVKEATKGYQANLDEIAVRVTDFNLQSIADAWGLKKDELQKEMSEALVLQPDIEKWKTEDVVKWFGLDKFDSAKAENIVQELVISAFSVPKGTKEELKENLKSQIPSADEIMDSINWNSFTVKQGEEIQQLLNPDVDLSQWGDISNKGSNNDKEMSYEEYYAESAEKAARTFSEKIHEALENSVDADLINQVLEKINLSGGSSEGGKPSFMSDAVADAIKNMDMTGINAEIDNLKNNTDTQLNAAFGAGTTTRMPVNVTLDYTLLNPSKTFNITGPGKTEGSSTVTVTANAAGGYASGKQLSWLAEEGYGEYVIPTNPARRSRAVSLWEEAGEALGVEKHAAGSFVGGVRQPSESSQRPLRMPGFVTPDSFIGNREQSDEEQGNTVAVPVFMPGNTSRNISINISMNPQFTINGNEGGGNILAQIRSNISSLADELADNIAGRLEDSFSNMPAGSEV